MGDQLGPSGLDPGEFAMCPFDDRLARTPYLVLPKLALQAMPMEWRMRFEAMLVEMDGAGLETPNYLVLRDERPYAWAVHEDEDDEFSRLDRVEVYLTDPWANYRHGDAFALSCEAAGVEARSDATPKSGAAGTAKARSRKGAAQKEAP